MHLLSEHIDLPASPEITHSIVVDLGLILRLSPFWTVKSLTPGDGGRYEAVLEQYATKQTSTLYFTKTRTNTNESVVFSVENAPFSEMAFAIEKSGKGMRLVLQLAINSEDAGVLEGTQREISFWLRSIGEYGKLAAGTGARKRAAKWFMDRVWLKLTLSERNIAIIITKISLLELALLLALVLMWRMLVR